MEKQAGDDDGPESEPVIPAREKTTGAAAGQSVSVASNEPKILAEFSPEELAFVADILSDEFWRCSAAKALLSGWEEITDPEEREKRRKKYEMVVARQKMETRVRLRLLQNAVDQGFGDL